MEESTCSVVQGARDVRIRRISSIGGSVSIGRPKLRGLHSLLSAPRLRRWAKTVKKWHGTTHSSHNSLSVAPNTLQHQFTVSPPNRVGAVLPTSGPWRAGSIWRSYCGLGHGESVYRGVDAVCPPDGSSWASAETWPDPSFQSRYSSVLWFPWTPH